MTSRASASSDASSTAYRRLNLGSGHFPAAGYVNVDYALSTHPDVRWDLDQFPYPLAEQSCDEIVASHVLEHLRDPFAAMREWHRLLRPGGRLYLRVPHFSRGFTNPDHRRGFDVSFPLYFDPRMPPWFCGTHFELDGLRLRWNGQPYLKRYVASAPIRAVALVIGKSIDALANLHPLIFSRLLSFWVGGFEEIEITFVRPR